MKCRECKEQKLSSEFPREVLGSGCAHAPTWCLECLEDWIEGCAVEGKAENPQDADITCPECEQPLDWADCQKLSSRLEGLKVGVLKSLVFKKAEEGRDLPESGTIRVCQLSGDVCFVEVHRGDSSKVVKEKIYRGSNVEVDRQRLFYRGREVFELPGDGGAGRPFSSYGIAFGETLHLMILLYEVTDRQDAVRNIEYALSWTPRQRGIRRTARVFIDAICFAAREDGEPLGHVTWNERSRRTFGSAVVHSGPAMDSCQQSMQVDCDGLPQDAAALVFALAAAPNYKNRYEHVTLSDFKSPGFSLRDTATGQQLTRDFQLAAAGDRQCFLLAMARRGPGGNAWTVQGVGQPCDGNAYDPHVIAAAVHELVRRAAITTGGSGGGEMAAWVPPMPARPVPGAAEARPSTAKANFWKQVMRALRKREGECEIFRLKQDLEVLAAWEGLDLHEDLDMAAVIRERGDIFEVRAGFGAGSGAWDAEVVVLTSSGWKAWEEDLEEAPGNAWKAWRSHCDEYRDHWRGAWDGYGTGKGKAFGKGTGKGGKGSKGDWGKGRGGGGGGGGGHGLGLRGRLYGGGQKGGARGGGFGEANPFGSGSSAAQPQDGGWGVHGP